MLRLSREALPMRRGSYRVQRLSVKRNTSQTVEYIAYLINDMYIIQIKVRYIYIYRVHYIDLGRRYWEDTERRLGRDWEDIGILGHRPVGMLGY